MNYKEKLEAFNAGKKYQQEVAFMMGMIGAGANEMVLDYGCGLGRMVWAMRDKDVACFGYDVLNYREQDNEFVFRDSYHFQFDKIYFMHSFAHMPKPGALFETTFKDMLKPGGRVYVFTPNRDWLEYMHNPDYVPDPTVVQHYNLQDLANMFGRHGYVVEQLGQFGATCNARVCERVFISARKNG